MLRIVHISDVHLSVQGLSDLQRHIVPALLDDLEKFNSEKNIDLICVTGDLINKAGESFKGGASEAFNTFKSEILDKIQSRIKISTDRIFFAAGNHDSCRDLEEEYSELGLKAYLTDEPKINSFILSKKDLGVDRIRPFKEFEKEFHKDFTGEKNITGFESTYRVVVDGVKVGIVCLNSAWRCWDSSADIGNIIVGEEQVITSIENTKDDEVKICLIHHSLESIASFDKKTIEPFIMKYFDLMLCGHVHEGDSWSKSNMYGGMAVSVSPSNWDYNLRSDSKVHANGYTVIDIDKKNGRGVVYARRFAFLKKCYDPNTDLGDDRGTTSLTFPTGEKLSKFDNEISAANTIKDFWYEGLNECLLSYNTETKAPKDINRMFVVPTIVEKISSAVEGENDEKEVSIKEICSCSSNYIIFGLKEVGKTTLLNKLVVELAENTHTYHKIPVYIDFKDIVNTRFETIISKFLHVKITDIEEYISDNNIVLLLDNLSFDNEYLHQLRRLESFLSTYKNVSVISTSNQLTECGVSFEVLEHSVFSQYSLLHIKSYKTREIKSLINNWFSNNTDIVKDGKLDKLIGVFGALNLPRTPLAISMFLWIFEQQENYKPINHATMLENFIERMFSKASKGEALSEKFDYKNKERLLADIAHEMLNKKNENYRIPFTELIVFVENKFKLKKFEKLYSPAKIIQHFVDKGLFVEEYFNNEYSIRFRFSCFFQYFITKKMEFDESFKNFVLSEDNFLQYINEIDYFTGLKRDQSDVLKTLVARMSEAYADTIKMIKGLELGFDAIFNHGPSIAASLDENFVEDLRVNGKPTEQEIDRVKDEMLEKVKPEKSIETKDFKLRPFQRMERLWTVSAKTLKNSEEVEVEGLKEDSYCKILECSMAFSSVYKIFLEKYLNESKNSPHVKVGQELLIGRNIIPLINQIVTYMSMGTSKLNVVIKEKIESDFKSVDVSDYERFMSVFLYSDLRGADYINYIEKFVKITKRQYILDMALFKIVGYYYFRSTPELDNNYENMIADILIKSKKLNKTAKTRIMEKYKKKKESKKGVSDPLMFF